MGAEAPSWTGLGTKSELSQEMGQEQNPSEMAEFKSELSQSAGEDTEQRGATSTILLPVF